MLVDFRWFSEFWQFASEWACKHLSLLHANNSYNNLEFCFECISVSSPCPGSFLNPSHFSVEIDRITFCVVVRKTSFNLIIQRLDSIGNHLHFGILCSMLQICIFRTFIKTALLQKHAHTRLNRNLKHEIIHIWNASDVKTSRKWLITRLNQWNLITMWLNGCPVITTQIGIKTSYY